MRLYAESSAVLAWLLGEPRGRKTLELLSNAELIIASDLTLVECDRVLIRAVTLEEIDEAEAARRRATLNLAASHWNVFRLQGEVVSRARRAFPSEPVRTLDALHLSCALFARSPPPGAHRFESGSPPALGSPHPGVAAGAGFSPIGGHSKEFSH